MNPEELQSRMREIFRLEAGELVIELESALLELEHTPDDTALLNRVFRALHTLKGSGATSGFGELSQFLHRVEDVFFAAREGRITINAQMVDHALAIKDAIVRFLGADPGKGPAVLDGAHADLQALMAALPTNAGASPEPEAMITAPSGGRFRIHFRPAAEMFRTGSDPGMFLDDLRALGRCVITGSTDALPEPGALDPESCYLAWNIELETSAGESAVREVFAFIEDECELQIEAAGEELQPVADSGRRGRKWLIAFVTDEHVCESPGVIDLLLRDLGQLGSIQLLERPANAMTGGWRIELEAREAIEAGPIRDAFVFLPGIEPEISMSEEHTALVDIARGKPRTAVADRTRNEQLRVSAGKLDRLVDMVGELVILRSLVGNACASMRHVPMELATASEGLDRLTKELRDVVLGIRMMPVGDTFATFRRLARDLARELGKEVDLVIEGAETEMDKTMLEQVKDPLVHLVRNCLDHGFETPAQRERAGKPRCGTLRLTAEHDGDRVCITVADDGAGLDAARIRAKAVERGLVAADAMPSEREIHQMIFMPGFSTAERVSEVSGRGVGMDVVKRAIEALRGTIEIESRPGAGTSVKLLVPLTLAIIEGLMVGIGGDRYILPLAIASETITFDPKLREHCNGRNLLELRRELIPYLDMRDAFGCTTPRPAEQRAVVVFCEGQRIGLIVDVVYGNHQTVVKSLGWAAQHVGVFSGSTILGDGRVALICDVPALVAHATSSNGVVHALEG